MTAQKDWSVRAREQQESVRTSMSAPTQDSNLMLMPSVDPMLTVSTVWAPTPAHVKQVRDCHEILYMSSEYLGYDYWAANAGCAEVDECTDPNYTAGST